MVAYRSRPGVVAVRSVSEEHLRGDPAGRADAGEGFAGRPPGRRCQAPASCRSRTSHASRRPTLPGAADEIVSPSGEGSGVTERYRTWVNAAPGASKSSDRGDGMSQRLFVEFFVSIGYGVLSSLVPIFNSEIYIVASQVGGFAAEATTAIGCAVGQSIGKVGIVLALRRGVNLRVLRRRRDRPRKPAGRFRTRLRDWSDRAMGLLGDPRWGVMIV